MKKQNHIMKIAGIILIVIFVFLLLFISWSDFFMTFNAHFRLLEILGPFLPLTLFGGIGLLLGDYYKWRGKKIQQGIYEAQQEMQINRQQTVSHYCPHCGRPLTNNTPFCPFCGNKL